MSRQFRSDDTSKWPYGFGTGKDGAYSSGGSATWSAANASCTGTSGATTLTLDSGTGFANGDLVLIHQTRGTGAGNYELNKIVSGGGTTTLTLAHALQNTYTDSGDSQAQICELKEYTTFIQNTGHTLTAPAWDGNKGGIIAFIAKTSTTITGDLSASGANGSQGTTNNSYGATSGAGFRGGNAVVSGSDGYGYSGEGYESDRALGKNYTSPWGTLGSDNAGGSTYGRSSHGGAGGNGTAGGMGSTTDASHQAGGGRTSGNAGLTSMMFGGGGAGGNGSSGTTTGGGGQGGGIVLIITPILTMNGNVYVWGGNGGSGNGGGNSGTGGSGGGGGSCLIKCKTATLGTNKINGDAGVGQNGGANGGAGRIHIDYKISYSGTTTPTIDARQDSTIDDLSRALFFGQL